MIAEPYICLNWPYAEFQIQWFADHQLKNLLYKWQPYADFEREKLKELSSERWPAGSYYSVCIGSSGFVLGFYSSKEQIGYTTNDYQRDSESSRLLKRAEFLKAVCEKEGIDWLPTQKEEKCDNPRPNHCYACEGRYGCWWIPKCPCDCHQEKCVCGCHFPTFK